jgi:dihydroflavonol-4-reductase
VTKPGDLILITGANGFIGSHLTEALLGRGYRVRCMVRRSSDLTFVEQLPVEWAYADLGDSDGLVRACRGVDAVCHGAALTRALDRETFMRTNAAGTEALARACIEANSHPVRFLLVSSQTAAGPSQRAGDYLDESRPPSPITWYGESKLAAEQALAKLNSQLPSTVVRSAAVYGPRDRDFFTYFHLVRWGLSLQLAGERYISLIYVLDLVALILLALEDDMAVGQMYFGCNRAHTYRAFSDAVAMALGKRPLRIVLPEAVLTPIVWWSNVQGRLTGRPALLNDQRARDMRQRYWLCSSEKARHELGFEPQYELSRGVQEAANWYVENGWL